MKTMIIFRAVNIPVIILIFLLSACVPNQQGQVRREEGETPTPGEALQADAAEYARQMGVSQEEALRRLQLQEEIGSLGARLEQEQAGTFAGLWIQHEPEFRLVIAFTMDGERTIRPYLEGKSYADLVELRTFAYTHLELKAAQQQITRAAEGLGIPISSSINVQENRVSVWVGNPELFLQEIHASGQELPAPVKVLAIDPEDLADSLRGGIETYQSPGRTTVIFPRQAPTNIYMEALLEGTLILDPKGCLRIESEGDGGHLVLWHHDHSLRFNGEAVEVLDGKGQVLGRVGEEITVGGGETSSAALPGLPLEACPGPYWVLGDIGPLESEATEIGLPAPPTPTEENPYTCANVERLPADSAEAQQILEEFIHNFKAEQPTEYMGMAILHRVDRLGDWALVQGSVSGEGGNVIGVQRSEEGYRLAEQYIITAPLASFEEPDQIIPEYFLEKLPQAPRELFTCMDQTWLLNRSAVSRPGEVHQLAFVTWSDGTTDGATEIQTLKSDGSERATIFSEAMLIIDLIPSPDGEKIAFAGCPGSLSTGCSPDEDLDVWAVNWNGAALTNLTPDSANSERHPDWSPDGKQIVFDSDRSGSAQIYVMNADGSGLKVLTEGAGPNTEPKWSPDGSWIAYHCTQGEGREQETHICVVSPEGEPAGEALVGMSPVWSPAGLDGGSRLAFLCFHKGRSDLCTVMPDGSELINLTNSPYDENSPAWSPDGSWLAYVSNRGEDVDIYKVCVTCPEAPVVVRLTDEPRDAGAPAWSPDGSLLAYKSFDDLMVVNADRSDASYLAGSVFGTPIWRPAKAP